MAIAKATSQQPLSLLIHNKPPANGKTTYHRSVFFILQAMESQSDNGKGRSWLAWSIVSLFFCLPLGIPAVILSVYIRKDNGINNYRSAKKKSTAVLTLNIISTVLGGITILMVIGVASIFLSCAAICAANNTINRK